MFGERVLHTRRKGLRNKSEGRAEESDEAAVRRERFFRSTFCAFLIAKDTTTPVFMSVRLYNLFLNSKQ